MRGEKDTRPCAGCGVQVTKLLSQAKGTRWYCTTACQQHYSPTGARSGQGPKPREELQDTRPCMNCGKMVTHYLSNTRVAGIWTCSRHCAAVCIMAHRRDAGTYVSPRKPRKGKMVPCEVCGTEFYRGPGVDRRFCSYACKTIDQGKNAIIKPCGYCGKEMRHSPSQAAVMYCSHRCKGDALTKRPLERMHNGRRARMDRNGYVMVFEPDHPNKAFHGWQYEHRVVVEAALGRYLTSEEVVDHINQIKDDNRPENLQVLNTSTHSVKTQVDMKASLAQLRTQAAKADEYERRFGPLT